MQGHTRRRALPLSDAAFERRLFEEGSITREELARANSARAVRQPLSDAAFERLMREEAAGRAQAAAPQSPRITNWREQADMRGVVPWAEEKTPESFNPRAQRRRDEATATRERYRNYYQGERPAEQKPGITVWEGGRKGIPGRETSGQRYYVIGKRPLENDHPRAVYGRSLGENKKLEHQQFIGNDGRNRGFYAEGFREDKETNIHRYEYLDANKYDADLIDESMREIESEMEKKHGKNGGYDLLLNNCQHYTDAVLKRAREKAVRSGRNLILK